MPAKIHYPMYTPANDIFNKKRSINICETAPDPFGFHHQRRLAGGGRRKCRDKDDLEVER